jgi:hypothetical protein
MMRIAWMALAVGLTLASTALPAEARTCSGDKTSEIAAVLSSLHAGLGEWYLKDWGSLKNAPPNKFWLGFIPLYGWPYLAIRSAIDSSRCQTIDRAY